MKTASFFAIGTLLLFTGCRRDDAPDPLADQRRPVSPKVSPVAGGRGEAGERGRSELSALLKKGKLSDDEVATVYNKLDSVNAASFDEVWQDVMALDISTHMRYRLLSQTLFGLAQSGGYEQALEIAKGEKNPANRATLLAGAIGGCRGPVGRMIGDFKGFSEAEQRAVSGQFCSSFASRGNLQPEDFRDLGKLGGMLKGNLAIGLDQYLSGDSGKLATVREICAGIAQQDPSNEGIYEQLLTFEVSQGTETPLDELKKLPVRPGDDRNNLINALSEKDPVGTANALLGTGDFAGYTLALSNWAKVDYDEAAKWIADHAASQTPEARDAAIGALAGTAARETHDYAAARKLLGEMTDPARRQVLEDQILNSERDGVRGEVKRNPEETLNAMVAGNSSHADSFLEDAMGSWVSSDPAKAQSWYEKNWSSLPQTKSQFIAAAYASQAIKQGDTDGASQWLGYIKDPKIRQRIQAAITGSAPP